MEEKIDLIEELVVAAEEPEIVETKKPPIKNTKSHTCNRILEISQKYGFPTDSKSTLMRKTKQELQLQLEGVIQRSMKVEIQKNDSTFETDEVQEKKESIVFLRLMNGLICKGIEKGGNVIFSKAKMNYEIQGLCERMEQQSELVDASLEQILEKYPTILSKFNSPFSKLALVYSGCLLQSIKYKDRTLEKKPELTIRKPQHVRVTTV